MKTKGTRLARLLKNIFVHFLSLDITNIRNECNNLSNKYRALWGLKNPSDFMSEYGLPNTSFGDGIRELDPPFLLRLPSTIRIDVLDLRYPNDRYTPAAVNFQDLINPVLVIFLPTLEVRGSTITWAHGSMMPFRSIIMHEFLHTCGDVPGLGEGLIDGVIRHTMIGIEALENLSSRRRKPAG